MINYFSKEVQGSNDWNDWRWQLRNRISTIAQLKDVLDISSIEEEHIKQSLTKFRMTMAPYYVSLMDRNDRKCPIRMESVPSYHETKVGENDLKDPLLINSKIDLLSDMGESS